MFFHSSDWTQPPSKAFKVTTVHDLAPIKFPKFHHPRIVSVHRRRLKWVKKEVDRIIVPSRTTKEDLEKQGVESKRVRIVPEASVHSAVEKNEVKKIKRKYKISDKYLLVVGVNPRKNIKRIMQAYDLVRAGENLKLVLVGQPSHIKVEERRGVRIVGHVDDKELSALYTGAEALVFPSLYEGFGLPILDAFVCQTPVVTSNFSSMPETAGEAAVLVDPQSVDSIVEGIKTALKEKKDLVKKGLKRAKEFSWEKTAQETLEVYDEVASSA